MFLQAVVYLLFTTVVLGHPKFSSSSVVDWYHIHETRMIANDVKYSLEDEQTAQYWENNAQDFINNKVANGINTNVAKNTIIFLGDGMSIPTLVAARIYKGQLENATGEESSLSFDAFPHSGLSKTYCVNAQVADSACTATAYLCGVKTNSGTIGVTANVTRGDCEAGANPDNHVYSIARWSQLQGKRTGLVTTTTVTHASPGGVYAHTANRDWESDTNVNAGGGDPQVCRDIAYQAVYGETGENLHVIFGGGRQNFLPKDTVDDEGTNGSRSDGIDLIEAWKEQQSSKGEAEYVWNRDQLLNISSDTDYVIGLFENGHMQYHLDANETSEPTLEEMTEAAIKVLSKGEKGFFLFVEGGRIDHGHHSTYAKKALDETVEFSKAIQKAVDMTSSEDTLIVVTSDHAHTLTVSGYPSRGNDILETAGTADDGLVYATLSYANGPGYHKMIESDGSRHDLSTDDMHGDNYEYPATVPLSSETHGGDDVGIFASGPWAHLLSGVVEQNVIPHVVAYASCVGNGTTACVL